MVFISGIAGQLFRDQALTVTFALVFSLVVALTLIPMLASIGAGSRYRDEAESLPPGRFTRGAAGIVRGFGALFLGISWLFRILLWVPTRLFQSLHSAVAAVYPAALRWSLDGTHDGWGSFGRPTGARVHVMGMSHAEFGPWGMRREFALYDEIAIWKQILLATG